MSAFFPTPLGLSQFVVYMGTAPQNTAAALAGLRGETEQLAGDALTPEALEGAKNKLLGQYALGKQTNAQLAQLYGWYEVLGLGVDFDQTFPEAVAAVTLEDAIAAAEATYQDPAVVLLGPEDAIAPVAATL